MGWIEGILEFLRHGPKNGTPNANEDIHRERVPTYFSHLRRRMHGAFGGIRSKCRATFVHWPIQAPSRHGHNVYLLSPPPSPLHTHPLPFHSLRFILSHILTIFHIDSTEHISHNKSPGIPPRFKVSTTETVTEHTPGMSHIYHRSTNALERLNRRLHEVFTTICIHLHTYGLRESVLCTKYAKGKGTYSV